MAQSSPVARVVISALLLGLCNCVVASDDGDGTEDPIVGGSPDTDGGAVVALRIGKGRMAELCSATAIAPNVLLTARHCVSKSLTKTVICNAKGASENGPHFGDDHPLEDIRVYTGAKPDFDGPTAASVRELVRPDGDVVCNQDIALLVLDKDLEGIAPLAVRLTRHVGVQETIRSVGYGKTDTGSTGQRLRRTGVTVRAIGPGLSPSDTALGANEFEVGMSICHGDSGGPAISQTTGAVIGVVSRGGDCGEDFGHVYTSTSGFAGLVDKAIHLAGIESAQLEPEPPPPAAKPANGAAKGAGGGCAVQPSSAGAAHASQSGAADWGKLGVFLALAAALVARRRPSKPPSKA